MNHFAACRLLTIFILTCSFTSFAFANNVTLSGGWSMQYSNSSAGTTVAMTAGKITNNATGGSSGSLRLELWAFNTPYNGGAQPGYRLSTYQMNALTGGSSYSNVSSGSVSASYPPSGNWYIAVLLTEFSSGTTWFTRDFKLSAKGYIMACTSTSCSNATAPATALLSANRSNYEANKEDSLTLSAKIDASSVASTLSDIYLSVSINNGQSFYLDPTLNWTASEVPAVKGFPFSDVDAPNFYSVPSKSLPPGNYKFAINVVESAPNPTALTASLAQGQSTIVFSDIPVVRFEPATTVLNNFQVGVQGSFDFSSIPTGGNSPYHFQLATFGGFPPIGLVLAPNGVLSGVPKVQSNRPFLVCAVDLSGNVSVNNQQRSTCTLITVNVQPAAGGVVTPPPAPPPVNNGPFLFANWSCGASTQCTSVMGGAQGATGLFCAAADCNAWGRKFIPSGYSCSTTASVANPRVSTGANGQCNVSGVDF